ncbi:MAG: 3-hydroxyacyl-CoA dehydrogenase NAD-binding domain-containing protein [Deltaproteobacteria bacterium]|nr:3-hydroxyacyl-CoA dehydrogenase NAD-binding domain-containing protein [Deltaproteobacteria bacterium]
MTTPRKIGIVGGGTMGSGIAQKVAQSGLKVVLMDVSDAQVQAGLSRIRSMLEEGVKRKVFAEGEPDRVLARITGTTKAEDLKDCDLVLEAVFEDLGVKRKLFAEVEKHVRPDAVLATNTSSFKVAAVAEGARHPQRFVGLHYFYHPAKNRLLEVIPGKGTAPAPLASAWAFAEATGKTPIHSADAPGFVVNRFFVPWLNESVRLLEEGVADLPTIEKTCKDLFGIGMGPFELMNVTGVPIAQHAAAGLASELGAFYAPCELLKKQVASKKNWDLAGEAGTRGAADVERRLLGVVLLVAAQLVDEGVASAEDTDIGAKVGLRWPIGPFALANQRGIAGAVAAAARVADTYGLPLPRSLAERKEKPVPFALKAVNLAVEDGIARITMNRPDVLNALDPDTVAALETAFNAAVADGKVKAIVIEGRGKAFVAGADIKFFVRAIDEKDIPRIVSFTRKGQELLLAIDRCDKPVVARVNGMALGGGAELALSCDAIVADESAVLGFPETGIGIYPGLGGTQRLVHRCGIGAARYLVMSGDILPAAKAAAIGLVDVVAPAGTSMSVVKQLLAEKRVKAGPGPSGLAKPTADKARYEKIFTDAGTAALMDGSFAPADKEGEKLKKKIAGKAPIALRMANELMQKALSLPVEKGVEEELASLPRIFSTEDARAGLGSVGKGRPEFKGR